MKIVFIALAILASVGFVLSVSYKSGYDAGMSKVQSEFNAYRLKQAEILANQLDLNSKTKADLDQTVSDLRVELEKSNHAIDKSKSIALNADLRHHRLQQAFDTCANSVNVLADGESTARADAESYSELLRELHEENVSEFARANTVAKHYNALIDVVASQQKALEATK